MTNVIGHRGAPRLARENTVESFLAAQAAGADMVELDVRRTPAGDLLVHHDALPSVIPPYVPNLAAALDACAGMTVNVEIKNSPRDPDFDAANMIATAVIEEIDRVGWIDRVIVSSFNRSTIDVIADRVRTGWLLLPQTDVLAMVEDTRVHRHDAIHPNDISVTEAAVRAAHDAGLQINAWTVDDHDRIRELASWGVDGIVTNVPDEAVALLRHH